MGDTGNGSFDVGALKVTAPPVPRVRPEGVPEHARPVLIRSVGRNRVREWRWVWWWSIESPHDGV